MYITNRPEIASIVYEAGVDRVFIDLEKIGKQLRQGGMDTVQSHHSVDDIAAVRKAFAGELLVRSNPMHADSQAEIDAIIKQGADIVMLPYFKTLNEAVRFIDIVNGCAKVSLLVETVEAVDKIDAILELDGVDEIHIGLNDLHLAYGMKFMFELLADGTVERLGRKILAAGIPYGFGGIAKLGGGALPAESVIKEHYRLNSTRAILSRSFCNVEQLSDLQEIKRIFEQGVAGIRALEAEVIAHKRYFDDNRTFVCEAVTDIVNRM